MIPEIKLTSAGAALLAKVPAGETVPLSRWQFGTGALAPGESIDRTALIAPIDYLEITSLENKETRSTVLGQFTNQGRETVSWEELGLLATDPDGGEILFCYGNAFGSGEKIQSGTEQLREFVFGTVLVFDSAENVTAVVDHGLVFIPLREKGQPSGVATLGTDGKVPSGQLPDMDYDPAGSAAAVQNLLAGHTANLDNPHQVKASQIPCLPWDNVLDAVSDINNQLNATAETQYRWQKYKYALQEVATNVSVHVYCYYRSQGEVEEDWSLNAYYASNGAYTFDDTTGLVITGTNAVEIRNNLDAIKGKYILINKANGQTSPATPGVPLYYVPITADVRSSSSSGTNWSRRNYYLEGITQYAIVKTDVENLYSASEDTYPKNISQGGYYYQYLGTEWGC